ncbi:MAG: GNAT family N-acetyltransferase [Candidatus Daviesbacteria bacterium]|nr:GNAT family N-acetyltransferase [Candidatus Daviesbacteria bacterium]
MIKITKASYRQIKDFNLKEWHGVDIEHYGKEVEWNDKKFIFKAEEEGQTVGTISGRYASGVVYISEIIVAKSKRGKGVGSALMKKIEEFGKKLGAHKIWLITGKDWSENKFYRKLGFKKGAILPRHNFEKEYIIYSKFI